MTRCPGGRHDRKPTKDSDVDLFLPLLLLIVLGGFMFMAQRRQKKAMQATIDLHDSLTVGDRIHTTSGLQGTITGISDGTVDLEIAPGVITTWMKLAVRDRIEPDDEFDDDDFDEDGTAVDETSRATELTAGSDEVKKD
jgi:preprotein translocase subunit YajC